MKVKCQPFLETHCTKVYELYKGQNLINAEKPGDLNLASDFGQWLRPFCQEVIKKKNKLSKVWILIYSR